MTRVAVTTTAGTSPGVADALIAEGLVPVMLPCIAISPARENVLVELRERAATADLIIVTSARAVRITWPDADMPPIAVAAVGPSTAEAVEAAGGTVKIVGAGGASELIDSLEVEGLVIVFPHARAADPASTTELERRGATVHGAVAYETVPIEPADDNVDAAVFGSPSAVDGWLLRRHLDGLTIGAMGPVTASALRVRGVADPVIPEQPGFKALARAMAERINK